MDGMGYGSVDADFDALFDLRRDPDCRENLYAGQPELRARCLARLRRSMEELRVPDEHFERLNVPGL
jgi:hypothetical protein